MSNSRRDNSHDTYNSSRSSGRYDVVNDDNDTNHRRRRSRHERDDGAATTEDDSLRERSHKRSRNGNGAVDDVKKESDGAVNALSAARTKESERQKEYTDRQARMAQWRAENENEESKLVATGDGSTKIGAAKSADESDDDDEETRSLKAMQQMLGFGDFGTTKNSAVATNQTTAARGTAAKHKARKYRQYMNRKNGFNRPLDKMN